MKIQNYIVVKINVTLTFSCYVKPRRSSCMYLLLHFSQGVEGGGGEYELTLLNICFFSNIYTKKIVIPNDKNVHIIQGCYRKTLSLEKRGSSFYTPTLSTK